MSKCVKCMDYYHPDYIMYQEIRGEMVKVCTFCRLDRKELTIEDENGKVIEIVDKKQASTKYKRWLGQLINDPKIAKVIQKATEK